MLCKPGPYVTQFTHRVQCIQYHRACHCRHKYHWVGLILQSTQIASLNYFSPSKLIRFVWIQTNTMHKFLTLRFVVEFAWAQYKFAMHHMLTAFKLPQEFPLRMRKWLVPVQIKKNLSHRLQCNGQSSDDSILHPDMEGPAFQIWLMHPHIKTWYGFPSLKNNNSKLMCKLMSSLCTLVTTICLETFTLRHPKKTHYTSNYNIWAHLISLRNIKSIF